MFACRVHFLTDETAAGSTDWVVLSALLVGLAMLVLAGLDSANREFADEVTERLSEITPALDR